MDQRFVLLLIAFLLHCSSFSGLAGQDCPECKGKLTKVGAVADDTTKPSNNIKVWNRSSCANFFYDAASLVCSRCWLSYSEQFQRWERSSELPDSFRRPLSAAIRAFPVPSSQSLKSLAVYSQEIAGGVVSESIVFWCSDSAPLVSKLRAYAQDHKLTIRTEKHGAQGVYVTVATTPNA